MREKRDKLAEAQALTSGTRSKQTFLQATKLHVDLDAQRKLRPGWVEARKNAFDPDAFGYIVVNLRANGEYYVIDGQHRTALLTAIGYQDQKVPCELFEGLTKAQEAAIFLVRNDRVSVRVFDKFRIRLTKGDEDVADMYRIVRAHGLTIDDQLGEGHITAVAALERVYNGLGLSRHAVPNTLAQTLRTITEAWGKDPKALDGAILEGVGYVCMRYNGTMDFTALSEHMAKYTGGPSGLIGTARALRALHGSTVARCVAGALVDSYNHHRKKRRVETWWAKD